MDKKRDDMVSLDEFKEFFNKLSTCDFASLTEFLFQIFDTNGNTKFKLVEVSCFSDQNSAHNNLNFCIILQLINGIRILDKKAADHQSFPVFESNFCVSWSNFSYLLLENGKLDASELAFVFKTAVSAMNKSYDEVQIKEIVEALWEDWGLDSHKDDLEINQVRKMFSAHEGLNEGLTKR